METLIVIGAISFVVPFSISNFLTSEILKYRLFKNLDEKHIRYTLKENEIKQEYLYPMNNLKDYNYDNDNDNDNDSNLYDNETKNKRKSKSVSFDNTYLVIPNINILTEKNINELWYNYKDYMNFKIEFVKNV